MRTLIRMAMGVVAIFVLVTAYQAHGRRVAVRQHDPRVGRPHDEFARWLTGMWDPVAQPTAAPIGIFFRDHHLGVLYMYPPGASIRQIPIALERLSDTSARLTPPPQATSSRWGQFEFGVRQGADRDLMMLQWEPQAGRSPVTYRRRRGHVDTGPGQG